MAMFEKNLGLSSDQILLDDTEIETNCKTFAEILAIEPGNEELINSKVKNKNRNEKA